MRVAYVTDQELYTPVDVRMFQRAIVTVMETSSTVSAYVVESVLRTRMVMGCVTQTKFLDVRTTAHVTTTLWRPMKMALVRHSMHVAFVEGKGFRKASVIVTETNWMR